MKIDGKQIAQDILDNLKKQVEKLKKKNITPHLAIILVGNDPASVSYVRQKELRAKDIGIKTTILHLPNKTSQANLLEAARQFNNNNNIHGIIIQQPLPKRINTSLIVNAVSAKKDVDGFHSNSHYKMPIAMAVLKILEKVYLSAPEIELRFVDWLKNKKIVVMGNGETGGKPIIAMFAEMKIPFAIIDSKTDKPENLTKKADILICAVGKTNMVKPQMIKKGVAIIGVGISRGENANLTGDYDQNTVKNIASFYTPTPGGVGPINVAMLLKNLVKASENFSC